MNSSCELQNPFGAIQDLAWTASGARILAHRLLITIPLARHGERLESGQQMHEINYIMAPIPCHRTGLGAAGIRRPRNVRPTSEWEFSAGNSNSARVAEREGLFAPRAHPSGRRSTPRPFGAALRALSPLRRCHTYLIQTHENLPNVWRRGRDSNPRRAFDPYALSRGAPSTTRPPLRI